MDDNEQSRTRRDKEPEKGISLLIALTAEERTVLQQAIVEGKLEQYGIPRTTIVTVEQPRLNPATDKDHQR
jgi:hypothetical protein